MPEGNKSRVSGDGVESNRPATNFPGISVDSKWVDCLVEKRGLALWLAVSFGKKGPVVPGSEDDKNSQWAYDYYACGINIIYGVNG